MASISCVGSRALRFSENVEGSAFLAQLRKQRIECHFCDIMLHVGDRCFPAHRNVLAASSAYFESVLRGHKVSREELKIHPPDAEHVQLLLDYMYSGSIVLDDANVRPLLDLADFFIVSKLKGFCEEYLKQNLSLDSCLQSKELSAAYRLTQLAAAARKFIRCNIHQVLNLPVVQNMSFPRIRELIADPKTGCSSLSAITLLNAIVTWVKRDIPNRTVCFGPLLESISWIEVQFADLAQHIESESLYEESKLALFALLKTLVANDISLGQYACDYEGLAPVFEVLLVAPDFAVAPVEDDVLAVSFDSDPISVEVIITKSCTSRCTSEHQTTNASAVSSSLLLHRELGGRERLSIEELVTRREDLPDFVSDEGEFSSDESGDSCSEKEVVMQWDADEADTMHCPHCNFSAGSATRLEQHLASVHEEDQTYKCKICSYECKWNRDYYRHMREHFSGPPYRCDDCDFVGRNIRTLTAHRVMHVDDRSHFCSLCDFTTKSRSDLNLHVKLHTEEKPFRCDHCGRSFGMRTTLNQHLATHLHDRSPSCHSCGFSKQYPSHSLSGRRGYSPGNLFHCPQANCGYHSPRRSQLAAHTRSHLSIRSHVCSTCGRGFIEKSHLIRHERIHLKEKPFKCETCDYSSTRRDKLKEHIQKHHPLGTLARDSRRTRRSQSQRHCVTSSGTLPDE